MSNERELRTFEEKLEDLLDSYPDTQYTLADAGKARIVVCERELYSIELKLTALGSIFGNLMEFNDGDFIGIGDILKELGLQVRKIHEELGKVDQSKRDHSFDSDESKNERKKFKRYQALETVAEVPDKEIFDEVNQEIRAAVNGTRWDNVDGIKSVVKEMRKASCNKLIMSAKEAITLLEEKHALRIKAGVIKKGKK